MPSETPSHGAGAADSESPDRLSIEQAADGTVVLSGEIDPSNVDRLRASLTKLRGAGQLVVDLQRVSYLDSAGVSALFDAAHADLRLLVRADTAVATVIKICALPLVAQVEYVPA
ncbi:MAG TPA: STAS domain-containing protein [Sporichthyaceae bacterium]|jgi:anti-anti-sigma factor|nr:STAS domain-containing protein [Sporichthyaceae bacterium]